MFALKNLVLTLHCQKYLYLFCPLLLVYDTLCIFMYSLMHVQVYQMSSPVRGRAMIINNRFFSSRRDRAGSEVDYKNLQRLFKDLRFDIVKTEMSFTDLTAQVVYYFNLYL